MDQFGFTLPEGYVCSKITLKDVEVVLVLFSSVIESNQYSCECRRNAITEPILPAPLKESHLCWQEL